MMVEIDTAFIIQMLKNIRDKEESGFYLTVGWMANAIELKAGKEEANKVRTIIEDIKSGKKSKYVQPYEDLQDFLILKHPEIKLEGITLSSKTRNIVDRIITEQKFYNKLKQNGLEASNKLLITGDDIEARKYLAEAIAESLEMPLYIINLFKCTKDEDIITDERMKLLFRYINRYQAVCYIEGLQNKNNLQDVFDGFLCKMCRCFSNRLFLISDNDYFRTSDIKKFDTIIHL